MKKIHEIKHKIKIDPENITDEGNYIPKADEFGNGWEELNEDRFKDISPSIVDVSYYAEFELILTITMCDYGIEKIHFWTDKVILTVETTERYKGTENEKIDEIIFKDVSFYIDMSFDNVEFAIELKKQGKCQITNI